MKYDLHLFFIFAIMRLIETNYFLQNRLALCACGRAERHNGRVFWMHDNTNTEKGDIYDHRDDCR